jgi:hypothetical protein
MSLRDYLRDCDEDPHMSFEGGDFQEINLTGGDISGFNFRNARLRSANLTGVTVIGTELEGADLSQCIGLKAERHAQARLPHFDQGHSIQPHAYPGDGGGGGGGAKADEPIVSSDNLTQTLKQAYSQHNGIMVPFEDAPIPFSELYTHLQLKGKVGFTQCEANEDIAFSALGLARDSHGKAISRRWIEGVAGTGKTTLVKRILHRWADPETAKASEPFLAHYQAVLYLPLRHILPLFKKRTKPYQYADFLKQSEEWQHHTLMNRGSQFNAASLSQLQLLLQHHPEQVLFLVDGLDEVDVNHSLLRDVLINPTKPHHFIITTRPQTIPTWLAPHINQEIVNCGFNHRARYEYVNKHFVRKKDHYEKLFKAKRIKYLPCTRALLTLENQKKTLRTWMEGQEHLDDFMDIPLNCHLICVAFSGSAAGRLADHPTMTQLYDQLLIQWIKRALTKSSSMREHYGIETATELDILSAIDDQFSEQELLERSQSWIHNLEAIAFECIQDGDSITVSRALIKAVIQAHNPDLTHKGQIDRIEELLVFGMLSHRGLTYDEPQDTDTYEYTHKTFLEYMAGRFIARHFMSTPEDNPFHQEIESLLFDAEAEAGPGFYQPKYSLLLRFASGALDQRVEQGLQTKEVLTLWVKKLLQAYQRSLWGSGALLQVFSCLVEMEHDWMLEPPADDILASSSERSGDGGGGKEREPSIDTIQSMKMMIMAMLWGYVKAHQSMRTESHNYFFDAGLTRLWRMACLQIMRHIKAISTKPSHYATKTFSIEKYPSYQDDYAALQHIIQTDAQASADPQLQAQAQKALELMGGAPCTFESVKLQTDIPPNKQPWVQICLEANDRLGIKIEQYKQTMQLIPFLTKINPSEEINLQFYYTPSRIKDLIKALIIQLRDRNDDISILATHTLCILHTTASSSFALDQSNLLIRALIKLLVAYTHGSITNPAANALARLAPIISQCTSKQKTWMVKTLIGQILNAYTIDEIYSGQQLDIVMTLSSLFLVISDWFTDKLKTDLVKAIIAQLEHKSDNVKAIAVYKLSMLVPLITHEPFKQQMQKLLTKVLIILLTSRFTDIADMANNALGNLIPIIQKCTDIQQRQLIDSLITQQENTDWTIRKNTAAALGALAPIIEKWTAELQTQLIADLISSLKGTDEYVRDSAAKALRSLAPVIEKCSAELQRQVTTDLISLLKDTNGGVRNLVAHVLGSLALVIEKCSTELQAQLITDLISLLKDTNIESRVSAANALRSLATLIRKCTFELQTQLITALIAELQYNTDSFASASAIKALGNLTPIIEKCTFELQKQLLTVCITLLQTKILGRGSVIIALRNLAPVIKTCTIELQRLLITTLITGLQDTDEDIREIVAETLVSLAPIIMALDLDHQRTILCQLLNPGDTVRYAKMQAIAIQALKQASNPFSISDYNQSADDTFTIIKTSLLTALRTQQDDEASLSADALFLFDKRSPTPIQHEEILSGLFEQDDDSMSDVSSREDIIWELPFETLKARIQWLVICSYHPSPFIRMQANFYLMLYSDTLRHYLALETLFKEDFHPDLVDTSLKMHLIDWRLPSIVYGPLPMQVQTIGKRPKLSNSVDDYRTAFHKLKHSLIQKGESILLGFTQSLPQKTTIEVTSPAIKEKVGIVNVRPEQLRLQMPVVSSQSVSTVWRKSAVETGDSVSDFKTVLSKLSHNSIP